MDKKLAVLQDLGLGKNESRAYIGLLREGRSTVVDIARASGVHRVNVYDAIRGLKAAGLVSEISVGGQRFFEAASPDRLKHLVKQKEAALDEIIPLLERPYEKSKNRAANFEGLDAIKSMLDEMIVVGKPIAAFGIPRDLPDLLAGFLTVFHRKRIEKKIPIRHIYNENAAERISYLRTLQLSDARYLPPEFSVPATTVIFGPMLAFWIWSDREPFSVLVESEVMADAYRKYFELLWESAR